MKRKLVKVTHMDGSVSYTIKVKVLPFIWIVDSECMGHYDVIYRNMDFEHAKKVLERRNEEDRKLRGRKIIRTETVEYIG